MAERVARLLAVVGQGMRICEVAKYLQVESIVILRWYQKHGVPSHSALARLTCDNVVAFTEDVQRWRQ